MPDVWPHLLNLWNRQLIELDGSWLTPGRIIIGLSALLLGLWLARLLSRFAVGRLLRGLRVDAGASVMLRAVIHYALVMLVLCIALQSAGVPLTAFTIFGGAIAIGVGFGSQNILNNFISGLIILFERPIKQGDLVQIGSQIGIVSRIGARATLLTDYKGITHLIPNSHFLEQPVTNWHFSDDLVCASISVGVAYGSDTALVQRVMKEVAQRHPRTVAEPEPCVLFNDFASDALVFEVLLWTPARRVIERRRVESEIRFAIDTAFRENGIVIAFPQRDVHVDASTPIPVRMV
jgi:potassium-dependent mechanosensitive channel